MTTRLFAVFSNPGDCEEALMEARDRGLIEDESLLKVVDKPEEEDDVPFLDTDVLVEGLIGFLGGGLAGLVGAAGLFAFAEFYNFPSASLLTIGTMGGAVFGGIIGIISVVSPSACLLEKFSISPVPLCNEDF